ncbi:Synaptobrevin [Cryptosporidium tyzzeri]|nr:Synaptobrevin [Cryptosporidium tyzzeri]
MICDDDFPARIAFSSIFEAYMNIKDKNQHELSLIDDKLIYRTIFTILNKYKPLISDAITESQTKIDKAREAINVSLKSFLDRGENLDELIQKSNDLSDSSKKLFKMSKKTKRPCCKKSVKEVLTAPASPSILPLRDANLPETVIKEVSKILYFGFGGFLTISIISLAVLQVNTNAVCDRVSSNKKFNRQF